MASCSYNPCDYVCGSVNLQIYRNGVPNDRAIVVHVPFERKGLMSTVLDCISEKVILIHGYPNNLYTMAGIEITDPMRLMNNGQYVVSGKYEKGFKLVNYGYPKNPLIAIGQNSHHVRNLEFENRPFDYFQLLKTRKKMRELKEPPPPVVNAKNNGTSLLNKKLTKPSPQLKGPRQDKTKIPCPLPPASTAKKSSSWTMTSRKSKARRKQSQTACLVNRGIQADVHKVCFPKKHVSPMAPPPMPPMRPKPPKKDIDEDGILWIKRPGTHMKNPYFSPIPSRVNSMTNTDDDEAPGERRFMNLDPILGSKKLFPHIETESQLIFLTRRDKQVTFVIDRRETRRGQISEAAAKSPDQLQVLFKVDDPREMQPNQPSESATQPRDPVPAWVARMESDFSSIRNTLDFETRSGLNREVGTSAEPTNEIDLIEGISTPQTGNLGVPDSNHYYQKE